MRRTGFITITAILVLSLTIAIWWLQINALPPITTRSPWAVPSSNAFDGIREASASLVNGEHLLYLEYATSRTPHLIQQEQDAIAQNKIALAKLERALPFPCVLLEHVSITTHEDIERLSALLTIIARVREEEGDDNGAMDACLQSFLAGEDLSHGDFSSELYTYRFIIKAIPTSWRLADRLTSRQAKAAIYRLEQIQRVRAPYSAILQYVRFSRQAGFRKRFRSSNWRWEEVKQEPSAGQRLRALQLFLSSDRSILEYDSVYYNYWITAAEGRTYAARGIPPREPSDAYHQLYAGSTSATRIGNSWCTDAEAQADISLLLTKLALRAYQLDHGVYPASLNQLAPVYLNSIPSDQFAITGPLRYKRTEKAYVLYSVGPDGKDNGGKAIYEPFYSSKSDPTESRQAEPDSTGDMVAGLSF